MESTAPPAAVARPKTAGWSSAKRLRAALADSSWDARWTVLAVLAFIGVAIWWVTQDTRVADFYSAIQTRFAFITHDAIARGALASPFTEFGNYNYPPLGRLIGALGTFVGGVNIKAVMLALDVVFVPALAAGCYGVGRRVAGPRAGLLAALFALGAPMIVSESHEVYLDPLQASMIALSVLALIASERFERVGVAVLAGIATGLAFLTKETTPIFLGGLIAVVLLRGGWRNWRGLSAWAAAVIVTAAPWYLYHFGRLKQLTGQVNSPPPHPIAESVPAHASVENATWYFWDAANIQLRAAFLALLIVGTIAAVRSTIRDRRPDNIYPELLGGALVSYVGMTLIAIKDPRYDLPALVYMAVLATAWIPGLKGVLRPALTAVLLGAVAASVASVAFGLGGRDYTLRASLPGAYPEKTNAERFITFYATTGWLAGPPESGDGNILALMRGLRHHGVRGFAACCAKEARPEGAVEGGANRVDFNVSGLVVMGREAGLHYVEQQSELGPRDVFLMAHAPIPGAPPCQRLRDGTGIYAVLGSPIGRSVSQYTFICPGRTPAIYSARL